MADAYRALWRHKWFVLLLTAGLVAAAWALTKQQQKIYKASTLIRVQQRTDNPEQVLGALETGQRLAQTYARIIETSTMAHRIFDELGQRIPYSAIKVSAAPVQDLELVTISASATSPDRAKAVANAAPPALRAFIRATGTPTDQVITVERAGRPSRPASPNLKLNLALALMLGLVFNGALALLIEVLSDRLPSPDELERVTGRPVIATIPNLKFGRGARLAITRSRAKEGAVVSEVRSG